MASSLAACVPDPVKRAREPPGTSRADLADTAPMRRNAKLQIKLTTTGARTGEPRLVTLYAWADHEDPHADGSLILVGSDGGEARHPAWVHNLRAQPVVTVQRGVETQEMEAREVTDPTEYAELWDFCADRFPQYNTYQARTDRRIPIFVLTPR